MGSTDTPETLADMRRGMNAMVTSFVEGDDGILRKILSLGIAPGDEILVLSTWPAVVFELGSTSYALDVEIAKRIRVTATTH
ncbi:MAG: FeoA family protein [Planctomycetota bacterium]|nr:FeoA family protein [Planctomycetota bacterium]